ncbi:MAG: beta-ketoacyl synthase chain length factor [Desulfobacterales bacterium]|nr:beta-ketoacyl synthase chain length factor [Desulfobacterales bacterium]
MTGIYITGIGMVTPMGDTGQTLAALEKDRICASPLTLFSHPDPPAAGQVRMDLPASAPGRTHALTEAAVRQIMAQCPGDVPDAVIMGVTTGGMPESEMRIKNHVTNPQAFAFHGLDTVARHAAAICGCTGPVLTVSTACSSGAAAIALAARMIGCGMAQTVLAGGADALCRLTCHGFAALQLIDPEGARPFDAHRKGMHLSEAAALVFLKGGQTPPQNAVAQILGAGLSCDAHHATSPHPEGLGAAMAMEAALKDAGLTPADIDYINLHGTGTIGNDAAEARAVHAVFGPNLPALSSVKGATGHSLAAAGALEAGLCARALADGFLPANTGMDTPDPDLGIHPLTRPQHKEIKTVLSNSFGFGGNNAALVLGSIREETRKKAANCKTNPDIMGVLTGVCITGAGGTEASLQAFCQNLSCAGVLSNKELSAGLDPKAVRRLKRLSRMAINITGQAVLRTKMENQISDLFFGTGWGALTETHDFLTRLFANQEQLSSPMDFAGSVHNAPAGQAALMLGARGANMTLTGQDDAFEQALIAARLMAGTNHAPCLVMAADEAHDPLGRLFDPSAALAKTPADGGGGLMLTSADTGIGIGPVWVLGSHDPDKTASALVEKLGGAKAAAARIGVIFAGIPAARADFARSLMKSFCRILDTNLPVVDYRKYTGEFATASAAAAGLAAGCMEKGFIPAGPAGDTKIDLRSRGILMINAGKTVTAVEMVHT